ncbi:MAG: hypothetical protein V4616_00155 [Bacteroidota bacterium]
MKNVTPTLLTILPEPHRLVNSWKSDLSLSKRSRLQRTAMQLARQYYLNRSHMENGLIEQGATITLRSRKFTYSWKVKGFTPANTFEIADTNNPSWALSFKVNDKGFCMDSDPAKSDYPLMILEHSEADNRGEFSTFNKDISDPFQQIYGTAGWDHRQLQWYWQTKKPKEFAYSLLVSAKLSTILEAEEVILFTIDAFNAHEGTYRISLYRPFDVRTIEFSLDGEISEIARMEYPGNEKAVEYGATGS